MNHEWYREHPAETYLSDEAKDELVRAWYLGSEDGDSEAELVWL